MSLLQITFYMLNKFSFILSIYFKMVNGHITEIKTFQNLYDYLKAVNIIDSLGETLQILGNPSSINYGCRYRSTHLRSCRKRLDVFVGLGKGQRLREHAMMGWVAQISIYCRHACHPFMFYWRACRPCWGFIARMSWWLTRWCGMNIWI